MVDGKPFFGNDASIALKNLPAEVIDKVQIFDKTSEQSEFTGFKDGQTSKTINIITKRDKRNGVFGKGLIGYANNKHYLLNGNINMFNGNRRISIIGMSNNINQQNFESQDMINPEKMNDGSGGSNQTANGINTIHSLGCNYSDNWGKKWLVTASYFFNQTHNITDLINTRTTFVNDTTNNYSTEKSKSNSQNNNHRFNMRMEYTIDSSNSLTIIPSFSFQKYTSNENISDTALNDKSLFLSKSHSLTNNSNQGYDFDNTIDFRHKFQKKGRTFFIEFKQSAIGKDGNNNTVSDNVYAKNPTNIDSTFQRTKSKTNDYEFSSRSSYTEPLGKNIMLMLSYNPSIAFNNSNKQTTQTLILDSNLSGKYLYYTNTQRGGFAVHIRKDDFNISTGCDIQDVNLIGTESFPKQITTKTSYTNFLPRTDISLKFAEHNMFHISYTTNTQTPSITQLLNTVNNTNQLSLTVGNPLLEQQYNHSIRAIVRIVDYSLTKTIFFAIQASTSNNYITQSNFTAINDTTVNSIKLQTGTKISKPINMDGYRNFHPFITYSFPLYPIKCNITFRGEYTYTRQPGMVNNKKNFSNNNTSGGDLSINSNISQNIDFRISYKANYSTIRNSLQQSSNRNYYTGNAMAKATILLFNHIALTSDCNITHYIGLGNQYNKASILWNAGIAFKCFKENAGEFKLSIYDILKRNKSITRTVTGTYIDDTQTNILNRYLMITFTYNIRKFGV